MTWRPLPDEEVPPVSVGSSLEDLVKRLGGGSPKTQATLFEAWRDAVGPGLRDHANPVSLVDGVLTIEVDDSAWSTQLKWLGRSLADHLNEACGSDYVERLNVRLTSPKSKSKGS